MENSWKRKVEEAEAKAKEAEERNIETARKLKNDGIPVGLIEKYTGIDSRIIETL